MAESIPQSAYRYTGEFRGKYTGNRADAGVSPVVDALLIYALASPIGRIVEALGERRVSSEQSGRSR
jgi:hypothetical protein